VATRRIPTKSAGIVGPRRDVDNALSLSCQVIIICQYWNIPMKGWSMGGSAGQLAADAITGPLSRRWEPSDATGRPGGRGEGRTTTWGRGGWPRVPRPAARSAPSPPPPTRPRVRSNPLEKNADFCRIPQGPPLTVGCLPCLLWVPSKEDPRAEKSERAQVFACACCSGPCCCASWSESSW
jgi:hypothetical protein